ncbi:MAG: D-alanyl-D-alanine carboxypeptidase family protein [Micrococcales bacterium]|nr:D-alanyl-D-alanine carboxypeptidase family protein [Micrococcales bacterium]
MPRFLDRALVRLDHAPYAHLAARGAATLVARRTDAARAGVVVGLVVAMTVSSLGFVAGGAREDTLRILAVERELAQARVDQVRTTQVAEARAAAAASAQAAVDKAVAVRASAAEVSVPDDALAALDAVTEQVQALVIQVLDTPVEIAPALGSESQVRGSAPPDLSAPATVTGFPVTTPETWPDPAADQAVILDVATTVVDEVKQMLPDLVVTDDVLDALLIAVDQLAESTAEVSAAAEANRVAAELEAAEAQAAAHAAAAHAAAEAAAAQARAARLARDARSLDAFSNGRIPLSALCVPAFNLNVHLRCDAAEMLDALNRAYRDRFGVNLQVTDSYRSLNGQILCRELKGFLCADPGTSQHGLGLAVDLGGPAARFGTVEHRWMMENIGELGWHKPAWSLQNGSKPEPWHFEFVGVK